MLFFFVQENETENICILSNISYSWCLKWEPIWQPHLLYLDRFYYGDSYIWTSPLQDMKESLMYSYLALRTTLWNTGEIAAIDDISVIIREAKR